MKTKIYVLRTAIIIVWATVSCYAQRPTGEQFASMPYADAESVLKTSAPGEAFSKYSSAALKSGRMDLVALCFSKMGFCGALYEQVTSLPESMWRDQILILMLKMRSPFWPSDNYGLSSEPRVIENGWSAPFESLTRKYLPNMNLTSDDLLAGTAARAKIASQIEQAAKLSVEVPVPPLPMEKTHLTPQLSAQTASSVAQLSSDAAMPPSEEEPSIQPLWLTGGALVLATLAWAVWRKSRKV